MAKMAILAPWEAILTPFGPPGQPWPLGHTPVAGKIGHFGPWGPSETPPEGAKMAILAPGRPPGGQEGPDTHQLDVQNRPPGGPQGPIWPNMAKYGQNGHFGPFGTLWEPLGGPWGPPQ